VVTERLSGAGVTESALQTSAEMAGLAGDRDTGRQEVAQLVHSRGAASVKGAIPRTWREAQGVRILWLAVGTQCEDHGGP
jgi:hypothetical protein